MDAAMAASSPPAGKPAGQRRAPAYTSEQLLQFMKAGVFSREEVRDIVCRAMGLATVTPQQNVVTPQQNVTTPTPKAKIAKRTPKVALPKALLLAPAASPTVTKSRKRKNTTPDSDLRDVVKNTTRRRFFMECCNLDSKLWHSSTKSDKQYMHRLLFERAADDVLDILHAEQPGKLRNLHDDKIKVAIRWQVARDRNNWAGKTPIRKSFHGDPMPFDFSSEFCKIEQALKMAQDLTKEKSHKSRQEVDRPLKKSETQFAALKIDDDKRSKSFINICLTCRVHVWTGAVEDCPKTMQLANPFETDWANSPNAQPYCAQCWQEEEKLMQKLGQEHCAVGPKRKKLNLDDAVAAAQANAIQDAIANTTTPPVPKNKKKGARNKKKGAKNKKTKKTKKNNKVAPKKQLGGVRTSAPVPKPKPLKWWQVCA